MIRWIISLFKKKEVKPLVDYLPSVKFPSTNYTKEDIQKILELYQEGVKYRTYPKAFYFEGVRFDKYTPESDWEWLNEQIKGE